MPESFSFLANIASAISRSFPSLSSDSTKSSVPRLSFDDRTVGLAIVAAMATDDPLPPPPPARSHPVPILSSPSAAAAMKRQRQRQAMPVDVSEDDEMTEMEIDETSEDYTCATAYAGGKAVSRTVYVDDGRGGFLHIRTDPANSTSNSESKKSKRKKIKGVVLRVTSPPPTMMMLLTFPGKDFLRRCHLCRKLLHGLDIFMYRGEQSFCSPECRYQYLLTDEQKYATDILKHVECAQPPGSAPIISPSLGAA